MDKQFFESYRREFPVIDKYIYLDHAGVAPISLRVKEAILTFLSESAGGGAFHYGKWAQQIVDARRTCAQLINAEPDEVAFVRSTSHGLSIVAQGLDWRTGDNLLIYEKDFPSNIYPWLDLRTKGVEVRIIPSRDGRILLEDIENLIDARTRLLAVSSVQFSNGFRLDLKRTGELCRSRSVLFCVDAIQSLGVCPMDVSASKIDFLSADGHKWLLGPEGIGIFYCRKELAKSLHPPLIGWKSVRSEFDFERTDYQLKDTSLRFEEGSMNLMGVFGLNAAIGMLLEIGIENIEQRVLDLGDTIIREAEKRAHVVRTPKLRESRGGNITFSGAFDPAGMRDALNKEGIMVNVRGGGIRMSPHFYNTEAEILTVFDTLDRLSQ